MSPYIKAAKVVVWLTQLGLSVLVPLAGFILLGAYLRNSRGWGDWVVLVGIALGLLGAAGGLINGFRTLQRLADDDPRTKGSNRHD